MRVGLVRAGQSIACRALPSMNLKKEGDGGASPIVTTKSFDHNDRMTSITR